MNILKLRNSLAISALVLASTSAFACPPQDRDATGACPAIGGGGNNDRYGNGGGYNNGGGYVGSIDSREEIERRHYEEDQRRERERRERENHYGHGNGHGHGGGHHHKPPHHNPPYYPPQPPPQHYYPPQPPPYYPPAPQPIYGEQVVQVNLYQQVYGYQQIDVDSLLSLYRYNGYRVTAVEVEAQSMNNYYNQGARISLRVNGYEFSSAYLSNYNQRHYLSAGHQQIGWDLRDLILQVDGNALITRVLVRISR